jgi:glutathione synthase/RimK-type ligase-like ATP-grasp enzyme
MEIHGFVLLLQHARCKSSLATVRCVSEHRLATILPSQLAKPAKSPLRQHLRDFGRSVTYQIGGLPIAVRGALSHYSVAPEAVVRRAYARRYWHPASLAELGQLFLAILICPIAVIALGLVFVAKNGSRVARGGRRGVCGQFADQLRLYISAGVLPPWYYIFELHRLPARVQARDFIYRWESKGGVMRLLKEGNRTPSSELNDKALFADHCRRHQIPTAPILAVLRGGGVELHVPPRELDADLFVKPVFGRGGRGAERWDFVDGRYRSPAGENLSFDELAERLVERSRDAPLLMQRRLKNCRGLESLNNGALSTVRILTCLNEAGEPEIIGAAMRMAIGGNRVVDNLHAGGIAAAVDLQTGALGPASNLGADCRLGWLNRHPDSGAQIEGTQLPMWSEVREFAIRIHRAFDDRLLVGWDIAITPDGPVLVEGNGAPDLDIMQRFLRQGLMAARLGALLAFHLSQSGLDGLPVA